eukprot:TRINITY_DN13729_c0_g1_i1.p1 TRINITY_DN13729_c0_g1~~TRINITY_DN13729_c0_g1_i1.p1  ORF type:complete len:119 (-),score=29.27 TRINITY_DN13729_c0_g1_i1:171-527(-)
MTFGEEDLDIDRRREAAMAATPLLQPNFKSASISDQQLQKLKELRRRRLQTKNLSANSNMKIGKKNTEKKSGSVLHDKVDIMQNQDDKNILSGESHQGATNGNFEETNKVILGLTLYF